MNYRSLKFNPSTKFLVTGGAGFIGSNLCEAILDMGYFVRCLDNFSTGYDHNIASFKNHENFELIRGDIQDLSTCKKACQGIDFVLHQAAWGSVPRSIEMPLIYEQINVAGTLNMLEASRNSDIKKFVYASSSSVYGDSEILPKKEGEEGNLLSPYAFTKHANEKYAKLYTDLYGLETYGLRYFNVFGRRQDPDSAYSAVIPRFIKLMLNNESPIIFGDGHQSRDFTYIENVIEVNLKACLADSKYAGEAFNVAYGEREILIDMYKILCNLLEKDIEPIISESRSGDIMHSLADISKAKQMLGYDPQFDFKKGIQLCVDWYKNSL